MLQKNIIMLKYKLLETKYLVVIFLGQKFKNIKSKLKLFCILKISWLKFCSINFSVRHKLVVA